jgi:N-acetyl sugar amidotransferase
VNYCTRCITPDSRPNIRFDERGGCNCATLEEKRSIDWRSRRETLLEVFADARARATGYDCIIPVSGGKDSTWQVVECLAAGMRPLCVTWRPPGRTTLGQANLDNLISLGVDHIDFSVNPEVEKKLAYRALVRCGSPAVPMHMALFGIPLTIAVRFGAPLVVWGENSAFEYGGPEADRRGADLDRAWLMRYGCTGGTTARDWLGDGVDERDLLPYTWPTDDELASVPVRAIFLGQYIPWDPVTTFEVASAHGFEACTDGPMTGSYDFADIDDSYLAIHHWLKWYKFGFTRTFDNLSLEIRNGRLSRDEAIAQVRGRGDERPVAAIEAFCRYVDISVDHFDEVVERFRNTDIWVQRDGTWMIDDFLVPDWPWSAECPA